MTLGQGHVKLDFTVTNKNEDAHAAEFYMTIPDGLSIKKFVRLEFYFVLQISVIYRPFLKMWTVKWTMKLLIVKVSLNSILVSKNLYVT